MKNGGLKVKNDGSTWFSYQQQGFNYLINGYVSEHGSPLGLSWMNGEWSIAVFDYQRVCKKFMVQPPACGFIGIQ